MAIAQRGQLNPQAAATKWSQRVGQSGATWLGGIQAPRRLPNADPAKNTAAWQQGVAAAGPAMEKGISDPSYLTRLETGAKNKQASYSGAGTAHQTDMQNAMNKVLPAIQNIVATLPPRGPRGTNNGRSAAVADGLHALRGTLKAR